jgi:hypothetical protein
VAEANQKYFSNMAEFLKVKKEGEGKWGLHIGFIIHIHTYTYTQERLIYRHTNLYFKMNADGVKCIHTDWLIRRHCITMGRRSTITVKKNRLFRLYICFRFWLHFNKMKLILPLSHYWKVILESI